MSLQVSNGRGESAKDLMQIYVVERDSKINESGMADMPGYGAPVSSARCMDDGPSRLKTSTLFIVPAPDDKEEERFPLSSQLYGSSCSPSLRSGCL